MDISGLTDKIPGQVSKYLDGLSFPAEKEEVVKQAEANQADAKIVAALKKLPPGVYNSANEVAEKVGASNLLG